MTSTILCGGITVYADRADYIVIETGREIGRIYEDRTASQPFWSILGVGACHAGIETTGVRRRSKRPKADFLRNYRRYLAWFKLEAER
jgi:hypothetical protein